jgi:hypothetical protein
LLGIEFPADPGNPAHLRAKVFGGFLPCWLCHREFSESQVLAIAVIPSS